MVEELLLYTSELLGTVIEKRRQHLDLFIFLLWRFGQRDDLHLGSFEEQFSFIYCILKLLRFLLVSAFGTGKNEFVIYGQHEWVLSFLSLSLNFPLMSAESEPGAHQRHRTKYMRKDIKLYLTRRDFVTNLEVFWCGSKLKTFGWRL